MVRLSPVRTRPTNHGSNNAVRWLEQQVVQAFADVATIAIIHAGLPPVDGLARATRRALAARNVIEQAKGVIAAQTGYDMAASFERLRALADASGQLLETFAQDLVNATARPSL